MAKVKITNPSPYKGGRMIHGADGAARRRCRICGRVIFVRNNEICRDCLQQITKQKI